MKALLKFYINLEDQYNDLQWTCKAYSDNMNKC